jgi:hypothetical protein
MYEHVKKQELLSTDNYIMTRPTDKYLQIFKQFFSWEQRYRIKYDYSYIFGYFDIVSDLFYIP